MLTRRARARLTGEGERASERANEHEKNAEQQNEFVRRKRERRLVLRGRGRGRVLPVRRGARERQGGGRDSEQGGRPEEDHDRHTGGGRAAARYADPPTPAAWRESRDLRETRFKASPFASCPDLRLPPSLFSSARRDGRVHGQVAGLGGERLALLQQSSEREQAQAVRVLRPRTRRAFSHSLPLDVLSRPESNPIQSSSISSRLAGGEGGASGRSPPLFWVLQRLRSGSLRPLFVLCIIRRWRVKVAIVFPFLSVSSRMGEAARWPTQPHSSLSLSLSL